MIHHCGPSKQKSISSVLRHVQTQRPKYCRTLEPRLKLIVVFSRRFKQLLQGKMAATSDKSPKEWWSLLKDLKANAKWADPDQHASLEDLTSFFRSLYQDVSLGRDAQHNPDLTFSCSDYFRSNPPTQPVADDPMEQPLTPTEVSQVIKRLSLGKATGLDNISNEMLKLAGLIHLPFFTKLFNHIYSSGCFPSIWKQAYISTLHKKGSKQDPANYRPLSITSCLGKVFTGTLNDRLMAFMIRKNIAHPFQGAFTRGRWGTDHIFLANTLFDQAKFLGHPLYTAFIDLQKAYDSVCRPLLFRKMVLTGLGPNFCSLVEDMYVNASYCLKVGNRLGVSFSTNVGLRQGDPLPPLLFNLFIADIVFAFTTGCAAPMIQDLPVPSVQFGDDICNFATTLPGLRASIKCTLDYCQANRLKVNMTKSCYSVFNAPKSIVPKDIVVQDQLLRYESAPCYLGVCMSDVKAEQNSVMLQKASRATYALRSMLDNTVAAKVVNKLYDQLIEPILLYAVEQWLPYIHPRMVDKSGPIETFASPSSQLSTEDTWKKFIYPHYNLHASTPIFAVRAELGQYPTFVAGISRLASYMSYISQDTAPPLIRKAVYTQKVMASQSKYNWWSNSWRILNHFKVQESDPTDPPPCVLKEEIRSQYRCWWLRKFANPDHSPKLRTFRLFKTSFGTSAYLDCGPYYLRPALLRFGCSNHRLDIELGRHNNVPRQDRSCRFCKTPSIGDEFHAFKCVAFMDLQVLCGVNVQSFPQFIAAMQSFEIRTQRYISLVMSRIRLR